MATQWYYAEQNERRGPVPEAQMRNLIATGQLTPDTLVWNAALTEWTPARSTELFTTTPPGQERCIITGKYFERSQMIQTKDGWVSAEGKDAYYQSLREGAPIPAADGVSNARRDRKYVVVPAGQPRLPLRCIKTNSPVTPAQCRRRTLYWYSPWIALSILISILIFLILYLVLRKKVVIEIPLSDAGRKRVRLHAAIAWLAGLGAIGLVVAGFSAPESLGLLAVAGLLLFLAALVYGSYKGTALRVAKLRNGEAWLSGAGPEFLASLPPY